MYEQIFKERCLSCGKVIEKISNNIMRCNYCLTMFKSYYCDDETKKSYTTQTKETYHELYNELKRKPYEIKAKYRDKECTLCIGEHNEIYINNLDGEYIYKSISPKELPEIYIRGT